MDDKAFNHTERVYNDLHEVSFEPDTYIT